MDNHSYDPSTESERNELLVYWFNKLVELPKQIRQDEVAKAKLPESLRQELKQLIHIDELSENDSSLFAGLSGINVAQLLPDSSDALSLLGKEIGSYRIVEILGQGGFGYVYAAVRSQDFQKRVAVKVLRFDRQINERIVKRFAAERQLLARMQHHHICRILDGGSLDDGRPYFVMEFIDGATITDYCDQKRLTVTQRLQPFFESMRSRGPRSSVGRSSSRLKTE
ncbi:MAG: protein kinase [Planctomycetales bacterium]|nr:protein kinase [Planctomycetales bacterium]